MTYVGLLDCNNFFVSCERLFRPDLRTRPTVVLSSNDGCVVARSPEIKAAGIPMGIPYFQVKKELKALDAAVFSSNFKLYRDISARVMTNLRSLAEGVEQYSVDEAFFTLDVKPEDVPMRLRFIKETIETVVGIPVSVGAAATKTIAKQASEQAKQGSGVCFLPMVRWEQQWAEVPIHEIWGVGRQSELRLRGAGVTTVADFMSLSTNQVQQLLGVGGVRLQFELRGVKTSMSGGEELQQSIMSTRSMRQSSDQKAVVWEALTYHINHVAEELRSFGASAQRMQIIIRPSRHGQWSLRGGSAEQFFDRPTDDTREFLKVARKLLDELYEADVPYKKVGVVLSKIRPLSEETGSLFEDEHTASKPQRIMSVIDKVNTRFGTQSITVGRVQQGTAWQSSQAQISPLYTTRWTDIAAVRA